MNQLMKFDNLNVEVITTEDGQPLFELYSTGAALGFTRANSVGNIYPRKDRINKCIENAEISMCVHNGHNYLTESDLYDFMLEARTEKCKAFRKWVVTEVLPAIRTQGVYITENASDEEINLAAKFGPRRIKNTFLNCSIEEIGATFSELKEYYKKQSTEDRLKAYNKVRNSLSDRYDNYMSNNNLGFAHEIKKFLDETLRPIESETKNRSNGAIKANQTKRINELQEQINSIMPKEDEFIKVNVHPFSNNSMYKPVINNKTKKPILVKTGVYKQWIDNPAWDSMPSSLGINWTKQVNIWLRFDYKSEFDSNNFIKPVIDQICRRYNTDDKNVVVKLAEPNNLVNDYEDGKIYICIKN